MTFEAHSPTSGDKASIVASSIQQAHLAKAISQFWTNFRIKGASTLKAYQIARMRSILMSMSDHQLKQINIKRTDIGWYAESLLSEE